MKKLINIIKEAIARMLHPYCGTDKCCGHCEKPKKDTNE